MPKRQERKKFQVFLLQDSWSKKVVRFWGNDLCQFCRIMG